MSSYESIGGESAVRTLTALGVPENTIGQIGEALAPLRGAIVTAPRADLAG